jgi:transcription elongation GreA/GreB family factor
VVKEALKQELIAILRADLETIERAHAAAAKGATDDEAKPENDKDTRAIEASYLARGQAARASELRVALADLGALPLRSFAGGARIALGALVCLIEDEDSTRVVFVAPHGGGSRLSSGSIHVVTPESPLGRALIGKCAGDAFDLVLAKKTRAIEIDTVE